MILYPYATPIILTDELFSRYGGNTDASTYELRQAAYQIAESAVYYDLETPLQVTTFTGTYLYSNSLFLDHTYVNRVIAVQFFNNQDEVVETVSGTANVNIRLDDPTLGVLRVYPLGYPTCTPGTYVEKVRVIYTAGFSSGTSYDSRILTAMTQYAMIQINEMVGYGNEAPGDVGIKSYDNQEYSEDRVALLRTGYGNSAKANFIHNILSPFRRRRFVGW